MRLREVGLSSQDNHRRVSWNQAPRRQSSRNTQKRVWSASTSRHPLLYWFYTQRRWEFDLPDSVTSHTLFPYCQKVNKEVERNEMEHMRHQVGASRVSGTGVCKRACGFAGDGRWGMSPETLSCLQGKKSLRVLSWLVGLQGFLFLSFYFSRLKNVSAMSILFFIIRKISHKIFKKILLPY